MTTSLAANGMWRSTSNCMVCASSWRVMRGTSMGRTTREDWLATELMTALVLTPC